MNDINSEFKNINENLRKDLERQGLVESKNLDEAISSSDAKALLDGYNKGQAKDEKELRKQLKKSHTEIVKSLDKSLKSFMEEEVKRLKKEFPDYNLTIHKIGKRVLKDVTGNSDSYFGDWYDTEEYRIAMTNKFSKGMTEAKERPLKKTDLKYGNIIRSKSNPEWGTWVIKDRTDHGRDWWVDIQGDRGGRVLSPEEAEDWILVKDLSSKYK